MILSANLSFLNKFEWIDSIVIELIYKLRRFRIPSNRAKQ